VDARGAIELKAEADFWRASFRAMGSPCEVLVATDDGDVAGRTARAVAAEAWRIERKFSRYREDNIVHAINSARGAPVRVDRETAGLLDLADTCYQLSEGLFDVTSGILRKVWRFDGGESLPERAEVRAVLRHVGWHRVRWRAPHLRMEPGMEIDFGGIGKEYAADRAAAIGADVAEVPVLVNFGGDIVATGGRATGDPWEVDIEKPGGPVRRPPRISLRRGAVATSGDARRFLLKDGIRYSHILDPRDGWPVRDAPRSVTVLEATCTLAGLMSTLAILKGRGAEHFLRKQKAEHWVVR
jgi:thiamine biosynthesis lipoprotein